MSNYHYLKPEIVAKLGSDALFQETDKQATRTAYAEAILDIGAKNDKVVVCDADVSKSIGTNMFHAKYPDRAFNFGIAEQNMFAAAAGMASTGLIPFVSTYAVFVYRALDQVRNSIHYTRMNVKIAASHSGITPGPDGVTHQGQEDLSILRALAGSTVLAAADSAATKMAAWAALEHKGPVYMDFTRDPVPRIYTDDFPFKIGRAVTVRDGKDVTIFAIRDLVAHALVAAERLSKQGVDVRVIDSYCLKPLDEEAILKAARETGAIVTAENNIMFGGLGSAVAETLVENDPVPMQRIAVKDTFAESGPYLPLIDKYGLSWNHIENAVKKVLARKKK
jgi:transketolase